MMLVAQARIDDLRGAADTYRAAHGRTQPASSFVPEASVTLRLGTARGEASLARLAALASAEPLQQPVLLAEVDGELVAGLALSDGRVITNQSHRTGDLIDLLRTRARQLTGNTRMSRLRSSARLCPAIGGKAISGVPRIY